MEYWQMSILTSMMFCASSFACASFASRFAAIALSIMWLVISIGHGGLRWKHEN